MLKERGWGFTAISPQHPDARRLSALSCGTLLEVKAVPRPGAVSESPVPCGQSVDSIDSKVRKCVAIIPRRSAKEHRSDTEKVHESMTWEKA